MSEPDTPRSRATVEASSDGLAALFENTLKELQLLLKNTGHSWSQTEDIQIDNLLVQLCVLRAELDVESGTLQWLEQERAEEAEVVRSSLELIRSSIDKVRSLASSENNTVKLDQVLQQLDSNVESLCDLSPSLQIVISLGQNKGGIAKVKQYMNEWSRKRSSAEPGAAGGLGSTSKPTPSSEESTKDTQPPSRPTLSQYSVHERDLLSVLEDSQKHSSRGEPFWPEGLLKRIMTRDRVLESLHPSAKAHINIILSPEKTASGLPGQGCVKIYALLTLVEKTEQIVSFIEEGLRDQDLPLRYDAMNFLRNGKALKCFQSWNRFEKIFFDQQQWGFAAPFLSLGPDHSPRHYDLDNRTVIPWAEDHADSALGIPSLTAAEFLGSICRITIDPDSQDLWEFLDELGLDETFFTLKSWYPERLVEEAFRKELHMFRMFNGNVHEHLVTLLASIRYQGRYHFLFPYAECDLSQFWQTVHPQPPPSHMEELLWLTKQLFGLIGALDVIHSAKDLGLDGQRYGRHGDIKPSNVLCFRTSRDPRGLLVLTDYGFSSLRREDSKSWAPNISFVDTPTYAPPEFNEVSANISREYDIWSLGCVFLEFITWFLGGGEFVNEFRAQRTSDPIGSAFFHRDLVGDDTNSFHVKPEVTHWVQRLYDHPNCNNVVQELLVIIETKMLVVITDEVKRASSGNLRRQFQKVHENCSADAQVMTKHPPAHPLSVSERSR